MIYPVAAQILIQHTKTEENHDYSLITKVSKNTMKAVSTLSEVHISL